MSSLDTNVLVRFLMQDEPEQGKAASRLIRQGVRGGSPMFIPITVTLELEWVLRSAFGLDKPAVLQAFHALLGSLELRFESEGPLEHALARYEQAKVDFADCLHVALADQADERPLWTFDKAAARVHGARLLRL